MSFQEGRISPEGGTCTISGAQDDTFDVAGQFDDGDGTLKFTRMLSHGVSGTVTATCTIAGETISRSMLSPMPGGVDAAADYDIRVALQDGAQTVVPFRSLAPGVTSEMTLELTYEDEPAVAGSKSSPSHRGDLVHHESRGGKARGDGRTEAGT